VVSCVVVVGVVVSCVVKPLDRLCDVEGATAAVGSAACSVAGAVLWVVGVLWTPGVVPTAPGAVECVVGVERCDVPVLPVAPVPPVCPIVGAELVVVGIAVMGDADV
jgi:hypothetical protein